MTPQKCISFAAGRIAANKPNFCYPKQPQLNKLCLSCSISWPESPGQTQPQHQGQWAGRFVAKWPSRQPGYLCAGSCSALPAWSWGYAVPLQVAIAFFDKINAKSVLPILLPLCRVQPAFFHVTVLLFCRRGKSYTSCLLPTGGTCRMETHARSRFHSFFGRYCLGWFVFFFTCSLKQFGGGFHSSRCQSCRAQGWFECCKCATTWAICHFARQGMELCPSLRPLQQCSLQSTVYQTGPPRYTWRFTAIVTASRACVLLAGHLCSFQTPQWAKWRDIKTFRSATNAHYWWQKHYSLQWQVRWQPGNSSDQNRSDAGLLALPENCRSDQELHGKKSNLISCQYPRRMSQHYVYSWFYSVCLKKKTNF